MPVHDGTLYRRRLHDILGHVCWSQIGTPRLSSELGLDIDTYGML